MFLSSVRDGRDEMRAEVGYNLPVTDEDTEDPYNDKNDDTVPYRKASLRHETPAMVVPS